MAVTAAMGPPTTRSMSQEHYDLFQGFSFDNIRSTLDPIQKVIENIDKRSVLPIWRYTLYTRYVGQFRPRNIGLLVKWKNFGKCHKGYTGPNTVDSFRSPWPPSLQQSTIQLTSDNIKLLTIHIYATGRILIQGTTCRAWFDTEFSKLCAIVHSLVLAKYSHPGVLSIPNQPAHTDFTVIGKVKEVANSELEEHNICSIFSGGAGPIMNVGALSTIREESDPLTREKESVSTTCVGTPSTSAEVLPAHAGEGLTSSAEVGQTSSAEVGQTSNSGDGQTSSVGERQACCHGEWQAGDVGERQTRNDSDGQASGVGEGKVSDVGEGQLSNVAEPSCSVGDGLTCRLGEGQSVSAELGQHSSERLELTCGVWEGQMESEGDGKSSDAMDRESPGASEGQCSTVGDGHSVEEGQGSSVGEGQSSSVGEGQGSSVGEGHGSSVGEKQSSSVDEGQGCSADEGQGNSVGEGQGSSVDEGQGNSVGDSFVGF